MVIVHDNTIQSYEVDFEANTLAFKTLDYVHKKTDVIFSGYLAHVFYDEMKGSIILDVEEYSLDYFLMAGSALVKERECSGWPIFYKTENELMEFFQANEYKVFEISSSYGLNGWIFAKQMSLVSL